VSRRTVVAEVDNEDKVAAIKDYLDFGWALVPIRPADKEPLVAWRPLQLPKTPTREQVFEWFDRWPQADVGILTGRRSRHLVIVDVDPKNGGTRPWDLPETLRATTPSGGEHLYFWGKGRTNAAPGLKGIDVRGEGGLVVAPPAIGRVWQNLDSANIADLPPWWGKGVMGRPRKAKVDRGVTTKVARRILDGTILKVTKAYPGERNTELFKMACYAFEKCQSLGLDTIEEELAEAAESVGLDPDEINLTISSARSRVLGR
jgi:hypothetical protein